MEKEEIIENTIVCHICKQAQPLTEYVKVYTETNSTGYTYLCKNCLKMMSLSNGKFTKKKVYEVCRMLDMPFINLIYKQANSRLDNKGNPLAEERKIGAYISILNGEKDLRTKSFEDGEQIKSVKAEVNPVILEKQRRDKEREDNIDLWGEGFSENEYKILNKKYNLLKNNYPLRTQMHKEMLVKYCKYAMREEQAVAEGSTADAKYWGDLASKIATNAKINPSQLSAADLSDGVSSFSQVAQAVEREKDIIPILPKYIARPQDRVDYTIYMIFDYLRSLENKSHITYAEVWDFMKSNYERNKSEFGDKIVPNESEIAKDAILVEGEQ